MTIIYNKNKLKGFFYWSGGTQAPSCEFSYSAASYTDADPDPTPTITGNTGGVFSSTAGLVINSVTGEIDLSASTLNTYVITYTVSGKACTQSVEITADFANTYSMNFDGVDDYISCGNLTALNTATEASWSCWLKDPDATITQYVFAQYGAVSIERQIRFFYRIDTGRIDILFVNIGYRVSGNAVLSAIAADQWFNLVVTFNGGNSQYDRVRVYIDGVLLTGNIFGGPTALATSPDDFLIGSVDPTVSYYNFEGNIDEFSIWDKELTQLEVTELYNSGTPTNLSSHSATSDLLDWWRMGEEATFSTNWTLVDQGSSSMNGTSANMIEADRESDTP